ncbi:MAG: hypothetical protein K9G26_04930 [Emcibacter sp.]|nr:hypothetical protein [Emcibacter sp.]
MRKPLAAIVGAAESTKIGLVPDMSSLGLHADAALNALRDAGLKPHDIDGIACTDANPADVAFYLGIKPDWMDGTNVGGCAPILHLQNAVAAIAAGYCKTVLITHGESGRSRQGAQLRIPNPSDLNGQFDFPFGYNGAITSFTLPAMRYMKECGVSEEKLAKVAVVSREWSAKNSRAFARDPITIDQVLESRMIAYPFRKLMCCLVTDGGGAFIVTSVDRAKDFPKPPVYVQGCASAAESYFTGPAYVGDPLYPELIRRAGKNVFQAAGLKNSDIDHAMIYDAFVHTPLWALEGLGFVKFGEAADFIWDGNTAPNGSLPMNSTGGGLSYTHTGHYGMFAVLESIRQLRGEAEAQVPGVQTSLAFAYGNVLSAVGATILSNVGE